MDELLNINNDDHDYIWLETDGRYARYQVAIDSHGDGISEWFCNDCGNPVDDIDEGCDECERCDCDCWYCDCECDDCDCDEGDDMD